MSLEQLLKSNANQLFEKFRRYYPEKSFTAEVESSLEWMDDLTERSVTGMLTNFRRDPITLFATPYILSLFYTQKACQFLENGEVESAWKYATEARYYTGMTEAALFGLERFLYETIHLPSLAGNQSRSKKYLRAKEKAAELILTSASERKTEEAARKREWKGWTSRPEASNAIVDALKIFAQENNIVLKEDALLGRIQTWIRDEEIVRKAFNETCSEQKIIKPKKAKPWMEA